MSSDSESSTTPPPSSSSESFSLVARFLPSADDKPRNATEQRVFKTPREKALSEGAKVAKALEPLLEEGAWAKVPDQLTLLQNWYERNKKYFHHCPQQYLFALSTASADLAKLEANQEEYKKLNKIDAKGFNTSKMFFKKLDKVIVDTLADYDEHPEKYDDDRESTEEDDVGGEGSGLEGSESSEEVEIRDDGLDLIRIYSFFGLKCESQYERARREMEEEKERLLKEIRKDSRLPILEDEELVKKLEGVIESFNAQVMSEVDMLRELDSLMVQTISKHLQLIIATEQMSNLLSPLVYITRVLTKESTERLFSLFDSILRIFIEDAKENNYNESVIQACKIRISGKERQPHTLLTKIINGVLLLAESVERSLQTDDIHATEFQINLSHISNAFCLLRVFYILMAGTQESKQEGKLIFTRNGQVKQNENDMEHVVRGYIVKLTHAMQSICYSLTDKQFEALVKNCFNMQGRFSSEFSRTFEVGTIMQLSMEPVKKSGESTTGPASAIDSKAPKTPIAKQVKARFVKPSNNVLLTFNKLLPEAEIATTLPMFSRRCFEIILRNTPSDPKVLVSSFFSESELARDRVQSLLMHITTMCRADILEEGLTLFQNSYISSAISNSDPRTQILYNRAILSIGLCAFKKGKFQLSKESLSELAFPYIKPKLILGQRYNDMELANMNNVKSKTELEVLLIKRALIPRHLHIQTDLIEIVSFLSCAFLDAATLASHIANGSTPSSYGKQIQIGRSLWSIYQHMSRSELIDGVDSPRGVMACYCRAILKGNWKQGVEILNKLFPVIYRGFHNEKIHGDYNEDPLYKMLCEKTKYASLDCYLVTCANTSSVIEIGGLASKYELNSRALVTYLKNRPGRNNFNIIDDEKKLSFNRQRSGFIEALRQANDTFNRR